MKATKLIEFLAKNIADLGDMEVNIAYKNGPKFTKIDDFRFTVDIDKDGEARIILREDVGNPSWVENPPEVYEYGLNAVVNEDYEYEICENAIHTKDCEGHKLMCKLNLNPQNCWRCPLHTHTKIKCTVTSTSTIGGDQNYSLLEDYESKYLEGLNKNKEDNKWEVKVGLYKCIKRMFDGTPDGKLLFDAGKIYRCISKHNIAEFETSPGHSEYITDPIVREHFIYISE